MFFAPATATGTGTDEEKDEDEEERPMGGKCDVVFFRCVAATLASPRQIQDHQATAVMCHYDTGGTDRPAVDRCVRFVAVAMSRGQRRFRSLWETDPEVADTATSAGSVLAVSFGLRNGHHHEQRGEGGGIKALTL